MTLAWIIIILRFAKLWCPHSTTLHSFSGIVVDAGLCFPDFPFKTGPLSPPPAQCVVTRRGFSAESSPGITQGYGHSLRMVLISNSIVERNTGPSPQLGTTPMGHPSSRAPCGNSCCSRYNDITAHLLLCPSCFSKQPPSWELSLVNLLHTNLLSLVCFLGD